jgi:alpha-mannosidase
LNDSKYGFDVEDNVFRLTLLRSSNKPDPHPDQGEQKFTYSLYPHAGSWRAAHTDEQALAVNIPLLARSTTVHPAGKSIPTLSIENVSGHGELVVSALKRSEDGKEYILRFYEADGQDTQARIVFDHPVRAQQVDILERPLEEQRLTTEGNSVTVPVGHNQIVTLRFDR